MANPTASAAKRGRNPLYPFVPIIDHGEQTVGVHRTRTEQIMGKAFQARAEAVAYAQTVIDGRAADLAKRLQDPRNRALRAQYGIGA